MPFGYPPRELTQIRRNDRWLLVLVAVWLVTVTGAMVWAFRYKSAPGAVAPAPGDWPSASRVARRAGRPALVLFAHPLCSCTRATLAELARLMATVGSEVDATVLFLVPAGVSADWTNSDLWNRASEIPGVRVAADADGREAERFGARTSGIVFFYDGSGTLRFSGGLTNSRGHEGTSTGFLAIVDLVRHRAGAPPVLPSSAAPSQNIPPRAASRAAPTETARRSIMDIAARVNHLVEVANSRFEAHQDSVHRGTDRLLAWLLVGEWLFGIVVALAFSAATWEGKTRVMNIHLPLAVFLGGAIALVPAMLGFVRPGWVVTRHTIAVGQVLMSALLIHLTGGRIETHFHVFGSLAFLAFYRDWKVLTTGTVVVAADHFLRGLLYPESVYGVPNPEWWRFLEHAFWVVFIDVVLYISCVRGLREMKQLAEQSAQLEALAESHEASAAA